MKGLITVLAVLVVVGLAFFLYRSPSAPPEMTEAEIAQIRAEVDSVTSEWWAVWSAGGDADRFFSFLADDAETVWISDANPLFGRADIEEAFRPVLENIQRQDNTPVEWRTIVIAPEVAYTVRINDAVQTFVTGDSGPVIRYAETLVWVKRDGEWRVLIGHGSTPNEPM